MNFRRNAGKSEISFSEIQYSRKILVLLTDQYDSLPGIENLE
jgi:hypothetical protein